MWTGTEPTRRHRRHCQNSADALLAPKPFLPGASSGIDAEVKAARNYRAIPLPDPSQNHSAAFLQYRPIRRFRGLSPVPGTPPEPLNFLIYPRRCDFSSRRNVSAPLFLLENAGLVDYIICRSSRKTPIFRPETGPAAPFVVTGNHIDREEAAETLRRNRVPESKKVVRS